MRLIIDSLLIASLHFFFFLSKIISDLFYGIFFSNKKINNTIIEEIILNRADRIGDAIVTLPSILAMKQIFGDKLTVLTSEYNDWVLKDFVKTKIISDNSKEVINEINKNKIFIDPVPDDRINNIFSGYFRVHFKHFIYNYKFSDYVVDDYYGLYSKLQQNEKISLAIRSLLKVNLKIEEFPHELKNYIASHHNSKIEKVIVQLGDFIILYVGNKSFRNLGLSQWVELIKGINFQGKICIIDDQSGLIINDLKKIFHKKENIFFLEDSYDLWTLMYLASHSLLLIGVDGGGFNFLQVPTNCFGIYTTTTNPHMWKPFSLSKYKILENGEDKILRTTTSNNKIKLIYYKSTYLRVLEELKGNKSSDFKSKLVESINIPLITTYINNSILNLKK